MAKLAHFTEVDAPELSQAQKLELIRLKSFYPYRIIYGALNSTTGEWFASAVTTKKAPNRLAREGWWVWTLN